jgi:hypothetical protein
MKRYTKNEWFAAASAQDYWAANKATFISTTILIHGAKQDSFCDLWEEADKTLPIPFGCSPWDTAFLAAQIGCEKAGL